MSEDHWRVFDLSQLTKLVEGSEPRLHEFLRGPTLSGVLYRLPAGAKDMQAPHLEEEIYIVLEGRARLKLDGRTHTVRPGMVLHVNATADHSFFDIDENLVLLAIFGNTR